MFSRQFWISVPLFVAFLLMAGPGQAGVVRSEHVAAEIVFENTSFVPGQTRQALLRLVMDPGWHTYWKNPGDSGQAVRIEWELPAGFQAGEIQWPVPQRISVPPLMTYGYEGEVDFLVAVQAPANIRPGEYAARVRANWLECADICLPGRAAWDLKLSVSDGGVAEKVAANGVPRSALFEQARSRLPVDDPGGTGRAFFADDRLFVPVPEDETGWLTSFYFYESSGELVEHAAPQTLERGSAGAFLVVPMNPNAPAAAELAGVLVRESWSGESVARELRRPLVAGSPLPGTAVAGGGQDSIGIFGAILFSFLGGMILNLMPCVFPVLSLKVFSFLRHAGSDSRSRLFSALAYTGGILATFWALAAVLLVLRGGGQAIGWGFQLQSPLFVFFLCVALFLFALNLLGVFEINLTLSASTDQDDRGYGGSFFSGILAVIVATPCTAPFMGAALGFALTQSVAISLAVFTSLGLGLAAPFLLLTFFPGLARLLPGPGDWMLVLKQVMGFFMLATVLWLVWVYGRLTDVDGVALLLGAFLLAGLGAWILGRWNLPTRSTVTRWFARAGALGLLLAALGAGTMATVPGLAFARSEGSVSRAKSKVEPGSSLPADAAVAAVVSDMRAFHAAQPGRPYWAEWSPQLVTGLRAAGVPVFIDFTADWCLSCKVNERVALGSERIWKRFEEAGIVTLKADWTNEDETIGKAIADYGRSGIPLYVLYDGAGGAARFLPEVLTEGIVLDALDDLP